MPDSVGGLMDINGFSVMWIGSGWIWLQFTGLLDKNGKEIYEGDIVRVPEGATWQGGFAYASFTGYIDYDPPEFYVNQQKNIEMTKKWSGQDYQWNEIEVIGNIYENSELLS
jgi:uncharacterized phage protein (TIGR01671 family)